MNLGVKFRLIALVTVVALMGAAIAFVIFTSQRQARELRERLGNIDTESDEIAAHFKDSLREVNNSRLQYAIRHDPAVWQQFLQGSQDLKAWIDAQAPHLRAEGEKDALAQVQAAYGDYLRRAGTMGPAASGGTPADFSRVHRRSRGNRGASSTWARRWRGRTASRATSCWRTRGSARCRCGGLSGLAAPALCLRGRAGRRRLPRPDRPAARSSWSRASRWPSATRSSPRSACSRPASRTRSAIR